MSDASNNAAEWTRIGKRVLILTTGEAGIVTGFYGMQYRLVRVGDSRTPLVVDLTDLGPADQHPSTVSRGDAVSRETESHVQHDSVPVETLRGCTDIPEDKYREHWLEQTGNHVGAAPSMAGALHIPEDGKPTNPKDAIATDKLPLHLLSPFVKAYQAIAHYLGNVKYGAWNWRAAGIRLSVYKAAHDRHMDAFWEGEFYDPVDGTPHLANAQCCLNILIDAWCTGNVIDDRPPSNAARLAEVRAELEALMPKIRAKYADKHPRHFTIADTNELSHLRVVQPQGDAR
ncbi:dATP/dGTP diphosphohydrolase domain-containing protein [Burkholderia cepacia]|uniref:dATP/dGTP diphosphohydrolase domain-containing protein n=1 Tax=Burkholderia cepacia TaxID=292 RepID=UPI001F312B42|nr:dATP/dGTP diphosphohydrolase domain-containing protein [Burkholderia cepacia]MCE4125782.1 DUF5664 domain-containing protein [Burkholderia cepacia]